MTFTFVPPSAVSLKTILLRARFEEMSAFVCPNLGRFAIQTRKRSNMCGRNRYCELQSRRQRSIIVTASAQPVIDHDPLARFDTELRNAHSHVDAAEHEFVSASGAAEAASKEGVDMDKLSLAYGHILARDARKIGSRLDIKQAGIGLVDACTGKVKEAPFEVSQFEAWLRQRTTKSTNSTDDGDCDTDMSKMYGYFIGRTLEASALELDPTLVSKGLEEGCNITTIPFPMEESKYDAQFDILSGHATSLTARNWERMADEFFANLKNAEYVTDLENDGFVLAIDGNTRCEGPSVTGSDVVDVILHGRFLDGRSFVVPTYSDEVDGLPDTVRIPLKDMPSSFRSGIVGMKAGQCRALFLHTYAAVEVVELFGGADKFPPNVALVFDIFLHRIHDSNT